MRQTFSSNELGYATPHTRDAPSLSFTGGISRFLAPN